MSSVPVHPGLYTEDVELEHALPSGTGDLYLPGRGAGLDTA